MTRTADRFTAPRLTEKNERGAIKVCGKKGQGEFVLEDAADVSLSNRP